MISMADEDNLDNPERRYGSSLFGKQERNITENRDFLEQKRLDDALRDAKPQFVKDGLGLQGSPSPPRRIEDEVRRTDFSNGAVIRQPGQPAFPADQTGGEPLRATSVDVYGAVNGAPGVFHLYQSSAPTPL